MKKTAFTLVELLVVIAIIGLLIGIALPAFRGARIAAKTTASKARISALAAGCEQFRAETSLGNVVPPSATDTGTMEIHPGWWQDSPDDSALRPTTGASILYLALTGHDQSGGRQFRPTGQPPSWAAYAPEVGAPRYGPYINDPESFTMTVNNGQLAYSDQFGNPILYYRVRKVAARNPADQASFQMITNDRTSPVHIGLVDFRDNEQLTPPWGTDPDLLQPYHRTWSTYYDGDEAFAMPFGLEDEFKPKLQPLSFDRLIVNALTRRGTMTDNGRWTKVVSAAPHNAGEFIMISAGADKVLGTPDDVANFTPNHQMQGNR